MYQSDVFVKDAFYAVIWTQSVKNPHMDFERRFFAAFYKKGFIFSVNQRRPTYAFTKEPVTTIYLRESEPLPNHIFKLMVELLPFAENAFLKFFYVYQIIEYLMFSTFKVKYEEIKSGLNAVPDMSVTALRDYLRRFSDAAKEDTRINILLNAKSSETEMMANAILDAIGVDKVGFSFADSVYKVRNLVFHDFTSVQGCEQEIDALSESLIRYLVARYIGWKEV